MLTTDASVWLCQISIDFPVTHLIVVDDEHSPKRKVMVPDPEATLEDAKCALNVFAH